MSEEKQSIARMRSNIYGFAARLFAKEVDGAFLQWLRTSEVRSTLKSFKVEVDALLPKDQPESAILEALSIEYTRLFIGPGKHLAPYESVHHPGGGGALMGQSATDVQSFVETCGFDFASDYHDLPDHISVEMEFMQQLAIGEAEQWDLGEWKRALEYTQVQQRFLKEHILKWAPTFCQKAMAMTDMPFYYTLISLVEAFLGFERHSFEHP